MTPPPPDPPPPPAALPGNRAAIPPPISPPPLSRISPPNWLSRHWKWFVPLACLLLVALVAGFVIAFFTLMKSCDAYAGAVARAEASPAVQAALGTPVKDGWYLTGNISESNDSGNANLQIPLRGPLGTACLYVTATRKFGEWHFDELIVKLDKTGREIDIATAPASATKSRN